MKKSNLKKEITKLQDAVEILFNENQVLKSHNLTLKLKNVELSKRVNELLAAENKPILEDLLSEEIKQVKSKRTRRKKPTNITQAVQRFFEKYNKSYNLADVTDFLHRTFDKSIKTSTVSSAIWTLCDRGTIVKKGNRPMMTYQRNKAVV